MFFSGLKVTYIVGERAKTMALTTAAATIVTVMQWGVTAKVAIEIPGAESQGWRQMTEDAARRGKKAEAAKSQVERL